MLSLRDPVNNTTTWAYDNLDRAISETNQLGNARTFQYDANSNLTQKSDRNNRVTQYTYDNLDRLKDEKWLDSQSQVIRTMSFAYDAVSNLTSASDPAASYAYVYDGLDRLTQQTQTLTGLTPQVVYAQTWDANSNRTSLSATIGGTADFKNDYLYDGLNRQTRVTQQGQTGGNAVAQKRVDLSYKADGQFDVIARYADVGGTQAVVSSAHTYDGMGQGLRTDFSTVKDAEQVVGVDGAGHSFAFGSAL
jgi:YD repeat-containing protein